MIVMIKRQNGPTANDDSSSKYRWEKGLRIEGLPFRVAMEGLYLDKSLAGKDFGGGREASGLGR